MVIRLKIDPGEVAADIKNICVSKGSAPRLVVLFPDMQLVRRFDVRWKSFFVLGILHCVRLFHAIWQLAKDFVASADRVLNLKEIYFLALHRCFKWAQDVSVRLNDFDLARQKFFKGIHRNENGCLYLLRISNSRRDNQTKTAWPEEQDDSQKDNFGSYQMFFSTISNVLDKSLSRNVFISQMIHRVLIENFYSFKEPTEVKFDVPSIAPDLDVFHSDEEGNQVNSVLAIFGPNGSGKTNLLKAFAFLKWFICDSAQEKPGENIPAMPFTFCKEGDEAWKIALEFTHDGKRYLYRLQCSRTRVLEESLHVKKARFNYIFERVWNPEKQAYDAKFQDFGDTNRLPLRENASIISVAVLQENSAAMTLSDYFAGFYTNINQEGRNETHDPDFHNVLATAEYLDESPGMLQAVNRHLRGSDLGLAGIEIEKLKVLNPESEPQEIHAPFGIHEVSGEVYRLPLFRESRGTQALFVLLRFILPVLQKGGLAVIDEFESGLHSHLIQKLVDLFYSRRTNRHKAQLIFTCHSDYLLTDLGKYQTILVEKDKNCISHAWRLDEVKGVRSKDNIHAKYHAGAYRAVPEL